MMGGVWWYIITHALGTIGREYSYILSSSDGDSDGGRVGAAASHLCMYVCVYRVRSSIVHAEQARNHGTVGRAGKGRRRWAVYKDRGVMRGARCRMQDARRVWCERVTEKRHEKRETRAAATALRETGISNYVLVVYTCTARPRRPRHCDSVGEGEGGQEKQYVVRYVS
ncbi:hypothetical protein OH76DRAFT_970573 [Lentinus brumalis]|uniref:Uncharacterized protein n=1 Tax=Lentinus brumalis TaxID=2498619 RepID=A0A371DPQ0_9APHY|nr:hypothetical protein OH76DRAFT_970573 [Polyporus brumalis]